MLLVLLPSVVKVNLLNDGLSVISVSSFREIEQGAHYIDLLDEEAFFEIAMVELVYKFNEKSYLKCLKR